MSPEQKAAAAEAKNKGNAAFSAGQFNEAVTHFTAAIAADPTDHIFFSNRRRGGAGGARERRAAAKPSGRRAREQRAPPSQGAWLRI